jgi:hypothetical protein
MASNRDEQPLNLPPPEAGVVANVEDPEEREEDEPKKPVDLNKLCGLSYRVLGLIFAGLWGAIILLQMVTLGVRTWVEQGSGDLGWKGSLTFCTDCLPGWQEEDTWEAISKKACRVDENWWLCDIAENLMDAAEAVSVLFSSLYASCCR